MTITSPQKTEEFINKPIRVLHIFSPNYKNRFGGPIFDWKFAFSRWEDRSILHLVLDSESWKIETGQIAFNFEPGNNQYLLSRWKRFLWLFKLIAFLHSHQNEYEILHIHVLWWSTLLVGVWAKRKNIPTIYQSVLMNEDTPSGIIIERSGKIKLWCLRKFSLILALSEYMYEDYNRFGFRNGQVITLTNSVDQNIFNPLSVSKEIYDLRSENSLPQDARILIFVGSLIQRKGVDVLINAFISAAREEPKLYLLLVGPSNKQENPSLDEELIQRLCTDLEKNGVQNRVRFMGLVHDRGRLADLYRAADIFVFPSRNEGLPNVVLEAMACGLPVIVSRLPVLEKVISDGENGVFVPVEDAERLKAAILSLAYDPSYARQLGRNAREYVESRHGFEQWQARLVKLYKHLMT